MEVSNSTSALAALGGLGRELDQISPRFDIEASQIHIIKTPKDFYETLKVGRLSLSGYHRLLYYDRQIMKLS